MNSQEAIEIVDSIVTRIGSDEQIDSVIADLTQVKTFIQGVDETISNLNADTHALNIKVRELQSANNTLFRQIGTQEEIARKASEEISAVSLINQIIP